MSAGRRAARSLAAVATAAAIACASGPAPPEPAAGEGRRLAWYDAQGSAIGSIPAPPAGWHHIWLAPDEASAFGLVTGSEVLWRADLTTGALTPAEYQLGEVPASGRLVHLSAGHGIIERPAPDHGLWVFARATPGTLQPFPGPDVPAADGRLSADDRWLAYVSHENARPEVYATTFPEADSRWLISPPAGGTHPVWRSDARELYYWAPGGRLMRTVLQRGDRFVLPALAEEVFTRPDLADAPFAVTRDSGRFLIAVKQ